MMTYIGKRVLQKSDNHSWYHDCLNCGGKGKLEVDPLSGLWYCHKCGAGGGTKRHTGNRWATEDSEGVLDKYTPLVRNDSTHVYWEYMRYRGLTDQEVYKLKPHLGASPYRIYFPVYHQTNVPAAWTGRLVFSMENFPAWRHDTGDVRFSEMLWGLREAEAEQAKQIVLCEGVFDAVKFDGGVAMFGKTLSPAQEDLIVKASFDRNVYVCTDGEAKEEGAKIAAGLARRCVKNVYQMFLPFGTDPGDTTRDVLLSYIRNSVRVG